MDIDPDDEKSGEERAPIQECTDSLKSCIQHRVYRSLFAGELLRPTVRRASGSHRMNIGIIFAKKGWPAQNWAGSEPKVSGRPR